MDLMLLLIEDGKAQRLKLESQMNETRATLSALPTEQFTSIENKLKENLRELELSVKKMKLQKFKRDAEDYEKGQVYRWNNPPERAREARTRRVSFNLYSSEDDRGSNTSMEQDFPEGNRPGFPPRQIQHGSARRAGGGDAPRLQPIHSREGLRKKNRVHYPR